MSSETRGTSRSEFLKQAAGATIVVAGAGVGAAAVAQDAAAATAAGRFSIEVDGVNVGRIAGIEGGGIEYDVLDDTPGSDNIQHHTLGQREWEDITLQVGSGMGKPMYQWIKDSLDMKYTRKSGAIIAADFDYKEKARREFTDALITEITFPALDVSSKEAGSITVKLSPSAVVDVPGSGAPVVAAKQKAWLCSQFRLIIQGVDTSRIASVDSFTWKLMRVPGTSGVGNAGHLGVSFAPASLPSWQGWFDNFAVGGDTTDERTGILEIVGNNGGAVLDLGLSNLGLFKVVRQEFGQANVRRVKAEMYCEEMHFDLKGGWA